MTASGLVHPLAGVVHQVEDGEGREALRVTARMVVALRGDAVAGVEAEGDRPGSVVEGGRNGEPTVKAGKVTLR